MMILLKFILSYILSYVIIYIMCKKVIKQELVVNYLINKYRLSKKNKDKLGHILKYIDAFIISIPLTIFITKSSKIYIIIIVSLIIIVILMLILYNLLGFILKKKGW